MVAATARTCGNAAGQVEEPVIELSSLAANPPYAEMTQSRGKRAPAVAHGTATHAEPPLVSRWPAYGLAGGGPLVSDDLDVDGGGDFGVQTDPDLMGPDGLDRVGDLDPAPVELRATGGADRVRDVTRADRAEQPAGRTGPGGQPHLQRGELGGGLLGVVEATDVTGGPRPLDQVTCFSPPRVQRMARPRGTR